MIKNKNTIPFLMFAIIVFAHICINYYFGSTSKNDDEHSAVQTPSAYAVEHNAPLQKTAITDYDIAGDLLFFSYSEGVSVVEAYNLNGDYVFSVHFSNQQNGTVLIRGEENKLYVRTKSDDVFVFEGDRLIETLRKEDADAAGYNYVWFSKKSSGVKFVGMHLRILDSIGRLSTDVPVPDRIIWNYYKQYSVFVGIGLVGVGFVIQRVIKKHLRCVRKKG